MKKEVYGVIYKIENKIDGKVYIGQTTNKYGFNGRYYGGWVKSTHNIHLKRAVEKYGEENFDVDKEFRKCYSEEELNHWEKKYIKRYKSNNPDYGYNKTEGGESTKFNEEVCKKRSEILKHNRDKIEVLRKISGENFNGVVNIYKSEWEKICKLKCVNSIRMAFIILLSFKIYNYKYNKDYLIARKSNIINESNNFRNRHVYDYLQEEGYIKELDSEYKDSIKLKLNYIDETSNILLTIDNFSNITTYFNELYKGWKYKECVECGKRIRVKSQNSRKKYCTKCATIVNKRKQKERNKNKRGDN